MSEHDYSDNGFHCSCLDAERETLLKQIAFRDERIRELGELVAELRAERQALLSVQGDKHD